MRCTALAWRVGPPSPLTSAPSFRPPYSVQTLSAGPRFSGLARNRLVGAALLTSCESGPPTTTTSHNAGRRGEAREEHLPCFQGCSPA